MFDDLDDYDKRERDRAAKALQDNATALIKPLVPLDAEERVERTFKQWNQIIREYIRNETALKLADKEGGKYAVPVKIKGGFPKPLAELINRYNDPVLWLLILAQPKLGGAIEGLTLLLENWPALEAWEQLPVEARDGQAPLSEALHVVSLLQQAALAEQVRKQLTEINEDILGAYFYPRGKTPWIELYWIPIAMLAAMLDVRLEDLTIVVLAHELAHGYTHLGRDIEGGFWREDAFAETDVFIKEGLAQFYTQAATAKLAERTPGPKQAYEKLLGLQSGPYLIHRKWLEDSSRRIGEAVRFTLIATRNRGVKSHDEWLTMLDEADIVLRRNK